MAVDLGTIGPPIRIELVADGSPIQRGIESAGVSLTRIVAVGRFVGEAIARLAIEAAQRLHQVFEGLVDGTSELSERLSGDANNAVTLFVNSINRITSVLLEALAEVLERTLPGLAKLTEELSRVDQNANTAKVALETFVATLKVTLSIGVLLGAFFQAAGQAVQAVWHAASAAFRGEWQKAMDALVTGTISIGEVAADAGRLLGDVWFETGVSLEEAGRRLNVRTGEVAGGLRRLAAEARRVFEATRTPFEALEERMRRLGAMLKAGVIDQETFERAVDRAQQVVSQTQKVMGDVAQAFERAFVDAVTGVKKLQDALWELLGDLAKIYARATFRSLLFAAFGNTPGMQRLFGGGLFANAAGGLYKVAGAGGIGSQVAAFRATPGENVAVWSGAPRRGTAAPLSVTVQDYHGVDVASRTLPSGDLELTLRDRSKRSPAHG